MKKVVFLLVCLCLFPGLMTAQEKGSYYLFDGFQTATVQLKDGARFAERMNYNLFTEKFCFIDRTDNKEKELANPQDIQTISFGARVFYPEITGEGIEILPTSPVIYVQYKAEMRKAASIGGYGQAQETSSIRTYGGASGGGQRFEFEADKLEMGKRYQRYWVEVKGKKKGFKNLKQFVKIYPKEVRPELEKYIDERKVNFDSVEQIVELCEFAEKL